MFAAQRLEKIKKIMYAQKNVNIATLCEILNVSDVTVRRDLEKLESDGFLFKTHGGAVLIEKEPNISALDAEIENYEAKSKIADLACTLIEKGDSIFLGPGSTCYILSKKLKDIENITIVTNNISALGELTPHIKNVYLLGGEMSYENRMLYSLDQRNPQLLEGTYVNKVFIGISGVELKAGFTANNLGLSIVLKQAAKTSKNVIFLADHTKFDKIGLYQVVPIDFPRCVVTDEKLGDDYKQYFYEHDIKVLTAYDI